MVITQSRNFLASRNGIQLYLNICFAARRVQCHLFNAHIRNIFMYLKICNVASLQLSFRSHECVSTQGISSHIGNCATIFTFIKIHCSRCSPDVLSMFFCSGYVYSWNPHPSSSNVSHLRSSYLPDSTSTHQRSVIFVFVCKLSISCYVKPILYSV